MSYNPILNQSLSFVNSFYQKRKNQKNNLHHRLKRLSFGGFRKKKQKGKQKINLYD